MKGTSSRVISNLQSADFYQQISFPYNLELLSLISLVFANAATVYDVIDIANQQESAHARPKVSYQGFKPTWLLKHPKQRILTI